jgi:phytoene dehydrogenase-like protein
MRVRVHEAESTFGGGMRTAALTLSGFRHDVCSAAHPFARLSPFFSSLPLAEHGLRWVYPAVEMAHPLDDGSAIAVMRDLGATASQLGNDAEAYRRLIGPLVAHLDELAVDVLAPVLHWPAHPISMLRFGARGTLSTKVLVAGEFATARARALFAGLGAHSFMPLDSPFTASFPLLFLACAHASGWPFARGGSQAIANALASLLCENGGEIITNTRMNRSAGSPISYFATRLPSCRFRNAVRASSRSITH